MASGSKNKIVPPVPENKEAALDTNRKRQIILGIGILFLMIGLFICFSIISYFFTWKVDQDNFFSNGSALRFLFKNHQKDVANWGGRMGAAISHTLVYEGAGVAAMAIGVWFGSTGLNILYGKNILPILRYLRWLSLALLITGPILAYILPHSAFPYGGAWGAVAIDYLNGLFGSGGTGMILIAISLFFIFTVFALDIRPMLQRMGVWTKKAVAAVVASTAKDENELENNNAENIVQPVVTEAPAIHNILNSEPIQDEHQLVINNETREDKWEMTLNEKAKEQLHRSLNDELAENTDEDTFEDELPELKYEEHNTGGLEEEPEFSFEVIKQVEEPAAIPKGGHISIANNEPYAPELDLPDFKFPTIDLLEDRSQEIVSFDKEELEKNKNQIIQTLKSFGIEIQRISATVGPTVTLYEIVPSEGVRISKIRNLEDDIALNLAALGIRIIAPIPGRGTIGIEVPNANKQIVSMRAIITSDKFVNNKMSLPIALGKKIDNENYIVDLATMPHLLMAGATGQGKSVGINTILVSLLYKKHPSQLKFIMVDPKKVELSIYKVIEKHYLAKLPNEEEAIITDTKKVIYTLNALCIEMDNRYELLKEAGARNIKEYNEKFISRRLNPERGHKYLPFIVLVIDEFADLIMTAGKEVEMPIARLAQLARAVGIHLIIATQRPSVNVITGTIKANFPARIAFKVSAKVDSRTILDAGGAEQLIGRGDMLVSHGSELLRLQCAFVDTPEVERIVEFIGKQRGYASAFELPEYEGDEEEPGKSADLSNRDKLFEDCAKAVVQTQSGSTSNLQRRFNLGYNRAGRIMDQLEAAGIVGPAMGSKPRDVYIRTEAELEQHLNNLF